MNSGEPTPSPLVLVRYEFGSPFLMATACTFDEALAEAREQFDLNEDTLIQLWAGTTPCALITETSWKHIGFLTTAANPLKVTVMTVNGMADLGQKMRKAKELKLAAKKEEALELASKNEVKEPENSAVGQMEETEDGTASLVADTRGDFVHVAPDDALATSLTSDPPSYDANLLRIQLYIPCGQTLWKMYDPESTTIGDLRKEFLAAHEEHDVPKCHAKQVYCSKELVLNFGLGLEKVPVDSMTVSDWLEQLRKDYPKSTRYHESRLKIEGWRIFSSYP